MNLKDKREELFKKENDIRSEIFRTPDDTKHFDKVADLRAELKETKNRRLFIKNFMETSRKVG